MNFIICSVKLGVKPEIIALPLHYRHFGWKDAWLLFHFGGSVGCLLKASKKIINKLTQLFADWWNCRETFSRKLSWFKDQRFDQFPPSPRPTSSKIKPWQQWRKSSHRQQCLWVNKNLSIRIPSVLSCQYRCICFQKGNSSYASLFHHNSPSSGGSWSAVEILLQPPKTCLGPTGAVALVPGRVDTGSLKWYFCVIQFEFRHLNCRLNCRYFRTI